MKIRLLYFASLRERVGVDEEWLELPADDVRGLRDHLARVRPELASLLPRVAIAVNQSYAGDAERLFENAEVALIPPIAGGAPDAPRLRDTRLSLDEVIAQVSWTGAGALATFTGVVRDESRGRAVTRLRYEAYPAMAESELARVEAEVVRRWPVVRCALRHRVGDLQLGEAAVVIAVAAPHRREAFAACEFAIDELKRSVPLWKKERGDGGDEWIEECVPGARERT